MYILRGIIPFVIYGHIFIFIFILDQESSGRVTHDSHKLQTKAINHSTRHYMNRRELESDQPIHVPLLDVLSFPPSGGQPQCIVAIARRRAPHLATTRKDMAAATVLRCMHCYSYTRRLVIARTEYESKPFKRQPAAKIAGIRYGLTCILW